MLSCAADGGLFGNFPSCSYVVATQTLTSTTAFTATTTNTDILFEIRVVVSGQILLEAGSFPGFVS